MFLFLGRRGSSNTNENDDHYFSSSNNNNNVVGVDEIDSGWVGATDELSAAKRHSLRSTSSFCDEVFLEELANMGMTGTCGAGGGGVGGISCSDEDAVSYGALSLGALSNYNNHHHHPHHVGATSASAAAASVMAVNSIVEFDEGNTNFIHVV